MDSATVIALYGLFERGDSFANRLNPPRLIAAVVILCNRLALFHWQILEPDGRGQMFLEYETELFVLL